MGNYCSEVYYQYCCCFECCDRDCVRECLSCECCECECCDCCSGDCFEDNSKKEKQRIIEIKNQNITYRFFSMDKTL